MRERDGWTNYFTATIDGQEPYEIHASSLAWALAQVYAGTEPGQSVLLKPEFGKARKFERTAEWFVERTTRQYEQNLLRI